MGMVFKNIEYMDGGVGLKISAVRLYLKVQKAVPGDVFSNEKTPEELPAENSDEQGEVSTSTSSCSGTNKNLHIQP